MKEYKVKSEKGRKYSLLDGEKYLGNLTYRKWYSMNSEIELDSYKKLSVVSKRIFNNATIVKSKETEVASFKMLWNGGVLISKNGKTYNLKSKGIFKSGFILTEESGSNKLLLTADYKMGWKYLLNEFTFHVSEELEHKSDKNEVLLITLAAIIYHITVVAASAA